MEKRIIGDTTVTNQGSWPSSINRQWLETRWETQDRLCWGPDEAGGLRTDNRPRSCSLAEEGSGEPASYTGYRQGVSGVWPEGWPRCSARPSGGALCRGHARYPAAAPIPYFTPGSSEVAVGWSFYFFFLVFLQLLSSLLQLSIQLFLVSPIQFLCSSLLEERFVPVQAPRQSKPGPGLSHYFFDKQNQLKLKSSPPKEKMRGSFWALKGQFPRIQVDVFKLTNDQILLSPASEKHPVDSLQNLKVARLGKLAKLAWSWIAQRINSQTSVHGARAGTQHCWVPWKPTGSFMGREWEALKDNTICVPPYRNTNFPYGGTISFRT